MTCGLQNRCPDDVTPENADTCESCPARVASGVAFLVESDPDFALVADRWPTLPEALRAGIVAMIRAI